MICICLRAVLTGHLADLHVASLQLRLFGVTIAGSADVPSLPCSTSSPLHHRNFRSHVFRSAKQPMHTSTGGFGALQAFWMDGVPPSNSHDSITCILKGESDAFKLHNIFISTMTHPVKLSNTLTKLVLELNGEPARKFYLHGVAG
jgi:hypothetical protein